MGSVMGGSVAPSPGPGFSKDAMDIEPQHGIGGDGIT